MLEQAEKLLQESGANGLEAAIKAGRILPGDVLLFARQGMLQDAIAFAQRRKTVRNAFAAWAGSGDESARRLLAVGIDPGCRGETLSVDDFVRLVRLPSPAVPGSG